MTVEPHLGDMIGQPIAPMRPYPKEPAPAWIERGIQVVIAGFAIAVFSALIIAWVVIWFLMVSSTAALSAEVYRIPDACIDLAKKYGVHDNLSRVEAEDVVAQLDQHLWWPGVSQCRKAVKRQWKI